MSMDETPFFTDDVGLIGELIRSEWSLEEEPVVAYDAESYMMNSRVGSIYVYQMSTSNGIVSTDYNTMKHQAFLGIKLSVRSRERFYEWGNEIYRIIWRHRRSPVLHRNGYTLMDLTAHRMHQNLSGWYACTFDIRLIRMHMPIVQNGFGGAVSGTIPEAGADDGMNTLVGGDPRT